MPDVRFHRPDWDVRPTCPPSLECFAQCPDLDRITKLCSGGMGLYIVDAVCGDPSGVERPIDETGLCLHVGHCHVVDRTAMVNT